MKLRTKWVVMPKFQWSIFMVSLISLLISFALVAAMTYMSYRSLVQEGVASQIAQNHPYYLFVKYQYAKLGSYLAIAAAVGVMLTALFTLYFSNKIAGPLYRLRKYLEEIEQSDSIKEIKFRKGDYLEDWSPLINHFAAKAHESSERPPALPKDLKPPKAS